MRKAKKELTIGQVTIGGHHPIAVQSMTTTKTEDIEGTIAQILALEEAGCDIVRVAVPSMEAAMAISKIKEAIHIPLVADIHFDYRLALAAMEAGADKIRINPGNIGSKDRVKEVIQGLKAHNIPVRIGVNAGSLRNDMKEKYGYTAKAMIESLKEQIAYFEEEGFDNIVLALKASDLHMAIEAYELAHDLYDYPLHIGITESGTVYSGTIKSAIGLGYLLYKGIGDTLRVSLTGDPVEEVKAGKAILKSLGLSKGVKMVSCPTCGRCNIDLIHLANRLEETISRLDKNITVAVMGCAVNGPGEASQADIGVAGGLGEALLFKKGKIIRKIKEENIEEELIKEIDKL